MENEIQLVLSEGRKEGLKYLVIQPRLEVLIGIIEAKILVNIHQLLQGDNSVYYDEYEKHFVERSYNDIVKDLAGMLSPSTIKKSVKNLREMGILITINNDQSKTKQWYSVNYDKVKTMDFMLEHFMVFILKTVHLFKVSELAKRQSFFVPSENNIFSVNEKIMKKYPDYIPEQYQPKILRSSRDRISALKPVVKKLLRRTDKTK
jgi:hypothetical protein